MQTKIQNIYFEGQCRILVTSDIHANLHRFKRLLAKMNYQHNIDYLIINGDIIEKGPENLETLNYIKSLATTTDKVFVTMGNCDELIPAILAEEELYAYYKKKPDSFVSECFRLLNLDISERYFSPQEIKRILWTHFGDLLSWVQQLPYVLKNEHYVFVHAGVPAKAKQLIPTDFETFLSLRNFYNIGHQLSQVVVVGHYPVRNYHVTDAYDNSIIIDEQKKIISLDGANQLDADGQLNGLIILKDKDQYTYQKVSIDEFPYAETIQSYQPTSEKLCHVIWPYQYIEKIEQGEDFSWCKVVDFAVADKVLLKNEYIDIATAKPEILKYHSAAKLAVTKGEKVKIVDNACSGFTYIKKNGVLGWIPKQILK